MNKTVWSIIQFVMLMITIMHFVNINMVGIEALMKEKTITGCRPPVGVYPVII